MNPTEIADALEKIATRQDDGGEFPSTAQMCVKCNTKAKIMMDGCITCLNCGDSKCSQVLISKLY